MCVGRGGGRAGDNKQTSTGGRRTMWKCVLGCIRAILVVYASVSPSRSALPCYRYKHSLSLVIVSSSILARETFDSIGLLKQDRAHVFAKSEK